MWLPYGLETSRYRFLVTHEVAHQWFYGLVGNDQAREPFADEAAADFVTRYVLSQRRGSNCSTGELDHTIYYYSSSCYFEVIYIQGGNLLNSARTRMGSSAFWAALRGYLADNRYRLVGTRDAPRRARRRHVAQPLVAVPAALPGPLLTRRGYGRSATRRSAARAWGIQRQSVGIRGRHARQPATSHALTARSSGPQRNPYSSRTPAGSNPTDGHIAQLYVSIGMRSRAGRTA